MSNQLKDTKSSIFLNLDTDEENSVENKVTLTKPKRKYSKKIKMNDKNIYFDNNLNIYYQNSLVGSFILHPQYKNFDQKIIENKKTKLEYIEKPTEEIINPIITNQNMLINKLIEDPFHSFQNANNKPQVELINTNKKKISNVIYNKEYHINDFTFNTKPIINRTPEFYKEQIKYIKTLPQPEQRSEEWYKLRKDRLTASELADALGEGHFKTTNDVILNKCGLGPVFKGNATTQWGVKYEYVAIQIYESRTKSTVCEYGLVPHSTIPFLGASPDGITEDGIMLEIKCPPKRKIVGIVPHHYWVQMQLQLEVCDLEMCDFEECKIMEYKDENLFYYDNYEDDYGNIDYNLTLNKMEKGVVIEYNNNETEKMEYIYAPLKLTHNEIRKWITENKNQLNLNKNYNNIKVSYWYLDTYSVTRVYRNRDWFEKKLPLMRDFWKDICYYRNVGCDEILNTIKNNKKENYDVSDYEDYKNKLNINDNILNHITFSDTDLELLSDYNDTTDNE
jgi:putative phage-type endonuclease